MSASHEYGHGHPEGARQENGAGSHGAHTSARDEIREDVHALREEAERAFDAAANETRRFANYVRSQATVAAERQKASLAGTIADVAGNIRSASAGFAEQPNLADVMEQAADRVAATASALDDRSVGELYLDAEDVCRRRPVAVALGAAALGLLVARAMKGSGSETR